MLDLEHRPKDENGTGAVPVAASLQGPKAATSARTFGHRQVLPSHEMNGVQKRQGAGSSQAMCLSGQHTAMTLPKTQI